MEVAWAKSRLLKCETAEEKRFSAWALFNSEVSPILFRMIIWIGVIPSNAQAAADEASSLRALKAGDLETARAIIRGWVTRDPQDLGAWLRLAGVARRAGQIPEAIEALDSALRIDPRCFPALLMMATVRESMGDTKLAAHHYSVAIAQAPPTWQIDPSALAALEHGRALVERHNRELRDFIHAVRTLSESDSTPLSM
jgi:tetratricopeptide (TPR) repeat protein